MFGSYLCGNPTVYADVDFLANSSTEGNSFSKIWEILSQAQPKFAVDLLLRTPAEIEERLAGNDLLAREIIEKGKVIHESAYT